MCFVVVCFRLQIANETNTHLQRECSAKADQVEAARQAHDTAESELREFTRKVAADSSSIHQACRSTQMSLQRECQNKTQTLHYLEQQLAAEKNRQKLTVRECERLKVSCCVNCFNADIIPG